MGKGKQKVRESDAKWLAGKRYGGAGFRRRGRLTAARHRDQNNPTQQGRGEATIKSDDGKLEDVPTEPVALIASRHRGPGDTAKG